MSHSIVVRQEEQDLMPSSKEVETLLKESCQNLTTTGKRKPGRPATVSWTQFCLSIVLCFWEGWTVQLDVWRVICGGILDLFAPVSICDQAVYNRLARVAGPMQVFFEQVSTQLRRHLQEELEPQSLVSFASQILAFDQCTLDQVARWLASLRPLKKGNSALLAGQLNALFDVVLQQWVFVDLVAGGVANCKARAKEVMERVPKGTLLLFDRGYFSFAWLDELTARGIWWISRYSNKASMKIVHPIYQGDGVLDAIVRLGVYRSDQAQQVVRLIQFWYKGTHYRYLTNVLDPRQLSVQQVVQLYARRWDIEMAFRLLKDYLRVNELWSAKWSVVQVQVWGGLVLAQVFHALQMQIARKAGVEPFDLSMELLVRWVPRLVHQGLDPVAFVLRWGRDLGIIRPSARGRKEVPWIDPSWNSPPPEELLRPREAVHHAQRKCHPRSKGSC
jgi:hypothetical protein